jgi:hypothetical protein
MRIKRRQRWHQEAKEEPEQERRAMSASRGYRHQEALEAAAREARFTSASSPHLFRREAIHRSEEEARQRNSAGHGGIEEAMEE